MRICHFIASRGLGRGEAYIDLVNSLCKVMDISLIIPANSLYKHRIHPSIKVYEYKSKNSRKNPFLLFEIYNIVKKIDPDIVHTHFAKATEIFYLLNKALKLPHIGTKHNPRKGKIFNKLQNVIAVSKGVAQSIKNPNTTVIYNGINPIDISKEKEKNSIFTITAIGRLDPIKGFDILIKECSKLSFDFKLEIIGDGEEKENLQRLINSLDMQEKVTLLGFREDIPNKIASAELVVVSSLSEGFSMVILETIFYGNLLLSTPVGIAKEVLDERFLIQENNFVFKLEEVFSNYSTLQKEFNLFKKGLQEYFLLSSITKKYIQYYKRCLQNDK